MRKKLLVIDLTDERIYRAYEEYSTLTKINDLAIFHDKIDLWIAAATKVSGATVLTIDGKGFKALRDDDHLDAVVLVPKTCWPVP